MSWPWNELGLSGPSDAEAIKHAYAQRLKEVHPEEDPEGFQRLQRAYQTARRIARMTTRREPVPDWTAPEETQPPPDAAAPETPEEPDNAPPVWDFDTLLSQGEQETEPEDEIPEEAPWVPPVYEYEGPRRRPRRRLRLSDGMKSVVVIAIFLAIGFALNWSNWFPRPIDKISETQEWLERTFHIDLVSSSHNKDREEDRFLYWLKDDPDVCFQAIYSEDGEFQTNYTSAMLYQELKSFSQEWPDYPLWFDRKMTDSVGEGASGGAPPAMFFFQIPLEGAEEFLNALGTRLEQLAGSSDWYQLQPPEFQIALLHGEAAVYSFHSSSGEVPTGEELVEFFEEEMTGALLQDLLFQQDVVLWDYPDQDNLIWANTGAGWVQDDEGWWISCRGTGRSGEDLTMYYFLRSDYTALYCIPGQVLEDPEEMMTLSCTETLTMSCGQTVDIYRVL